MDSCPLACVINAPTLMLLTSQSFEVQSFVYKLKEGNFVSPTKYKKFFEVKTNPVPGWVSFIQKELSKLEG